MKIAIFQADAKPVSIQRRLKSLDNILENNKSHKPDMLLLPELFLSGYGNEKLIKKSACSIESKTIQELAAIAVRHNVALVCGYAEKEGENLFNSVLFISSAGQLMANHRKRIFPTEYEKNLFEPGNELTLIDLENGWKIALLICYEVEFPEAVRACAKAGANLVLVPTALGLKWSVVSRQVIPTRAFENGLYIAYANFCGSDETGRYLGDSVIVSPMGEDLARAGDLEELISAKMDKKWIKNARNRLPYLKDYKNIV